MACAPASNAAPRSAGASPLTCRKRSSPARAVDFRLSRRHDGRIGGDAFKYLHVAEIDHRFQIGALAPRSSRSFSPDPVRKKVEDEM